MNASRRAWFLRYAAIQFVALIACAMLAYPGGGWLDPRASRYELTRNFLSDLGALHTFAGRANYLSAALFAVALTTIGGALVAFAWAWRQFAFGLGRARVAGIASAWLGTASGLAFAAIPFVPIDVALHVHNSLVVAAFGLLFGYVAALAVLMWRNRVRGLVAHVAYVVVICAYFVVVLAGFRAGAGSEHAFVVQVVGQKCVAAVSMLHIAYLSSVARSLARAS